MLSCQQTILPGQPPVSKVCWDVKSNFLALQSTSMPDEIYITILSSAEAQHCLLVDKRDPQIECDNIALAWSPGGSPVTLLVARSGRIQAWTQTTTSSSSNTWHNSLITSPVANLVTSTFLHPPLAWARRQRQAHKLEPMCEDQGVMQDTDFEPGIAARFATSKAFSSTQGQIDRVPHWVRSSSLCGAAVLSDGNILFFWNVLAAAGMPTWHVSAPTPLNCPGTITHATITVSPDATLTAAIQTLEQPNRLHMISVKGNPTELGHAIRQQSVECHQVGMIEAPARDALLECMFAPQSAGNALLILSHTSPGKLAMGRYLQHSGNEAMSETASWTLQASYQTPGGPLQDKGHPPHQFGSAQMMASSDGSQVVLITAIPSNPLQLVAHVLHPHTLHLQAKWELPCSCAAAVVSPNGCALATIHQTTYQSLPCLHQSSESIASQAVNESLKQKLATQRPAEHEAVSQQPAEHEYGDPMAVDLPERQKETGTKTVDMSPWATETMVKFGVLLPEAKSLVQVSAQSSGHKTDEGCKAEEVQAQNARSSSSIAAQVKHEHGEKKSSVRVTAAADGSGRLQRLSDALIDRFFWSLVNHSSSWDVTQSIKSLAILQGDAWLADLLSKVDHAMQGQHDNRAYYATAVDMMKLAVLQDVADPTAKAIRQDIWLRRHVAALDSVVSLYCNPADLATKAFATHKLDPKDQQVLRQWLSKADDIVTYVLHFVFRWIEDHEQAARDGVTEGPFQDALPCIRLLADNQVIKHLGKALMAYLAVNRSGSAAAPQAPGKPQAQQAGLHQLTPDMLLRVKQLYSAFQSIVRLIQQAHTGKAAGPGDSAHSPEKPARSPQESQASFEGSYHLHYVKPGGRVQWQQLQIVKAQITLPGFQGCTPQLSTGELDAMAKQLGLNQSVGAGPLQTAPWNQLHARLPKLPSQTAPLAPLNVEVDSLAGQMFNHRSEASHKRRRLRADRDAAMAPLRTYCRSEQVDAVSGSTLAWPDACTQVCANGCCATAGSWSQKQMPDSSLYAQVLKRKWSNACPLTCSAWMPCLPETMLIE
ncbi:hypothetical protein WJX77_001111 [Trebouxia sp. C0004]